MGSSLEHSGRDIVYSCSWPAYLGSNESTKPYADMIKAGCNLWRNWDDIQCSWNSLAGIIDHYGDYSKVLRQWVAPGHFNGIFFLREQEQRSEKDPFFSKNIPPLLFVRHLATYIYIYMRTHASTHARTHGHTYIRTQRGRGGREANRLTQLQH